ncbi:hypothetical protein LTR17_017467 [Elasticomyces elasticus]|nr:hypothetical protein LTR17_017467 [Elasticomyces elasticus]
MAPPLPHSIIDLTTDLKDHLTALPTELQHQIFDLLLPSHEPDIAYLPGIRRDRLHPIYQVASTCRSLRDQVDSWSHHWLKSHTAITRYRDNQTTSAGRKILVRKAGLRGVLQFVKSKCVFCGMITKHSAVFANGLRCCVKCDKQQWPDKITRTAAKEKFGLKDNQLLPARHPAVHHNHPQSTLAMSKSPFQKPRYGTCVIANVQTTMFLETDVHRLAQQVYGGHLELYWERREAEREERKQKKEASACKELDKVDLEWIKINEPFRYAKETGGSKEAAARELQELMGQVGVTVGDLRIGATGLRSLFNLSF